MEGHLLRVMVLLALAASGAARVVTKSHNVTKQNLNDIEEFVEGVLECWEAPGINVAIVNNGEVSRPVM